MSFLKQWRPGGMKGTPQQLLEIKSLRAELDAKQQAHTQELQALRDRIKDRQEEAIIARGVAQNSISRIKAETTALTADCARMRSATAEMEAEVAAQREQTRREAIELASTCGIHQPER